jgi:hypothetical protein
MTTDVYPREKCIAPAIVLIVWTTDTKNGRGLAPDCVPIVAIRPQKREASHTGGTQERWVWVGTRSRVIDLRLPTGREGVGGGVEGGEGKSVCGRTYVAVSYGRTTRGHVELPGDRHTHLFHNPMCKNL